MRAITGALMWDGDTFLAARAIIVDGDAVSGVVTKDDIPPEAVVEDWGEVAILPGTVNAHGHAFQSLFKGYASDRTFASWRDDVLYPFSERLDRDAIYAGALFAFAEALLAGITTTVDFFYLHDGGNANAEAVIDAARALGIRLVFARTFYDLEAPTAAPGRYREDASDAAERTREAAVRWQGDPLLSVQPAPHSLHAASPETIRTALDLAEELDVPCHLHLAEARYEREQIVERYGLTPVRLLEKERLLTDRLVTIHTVWVDEEELDLIAASGAGVVHCPGANAFLGDGIARVPEMLSRGIRVALGPDGGCANDRQSVFEEMRMAALIAKARMEDGSALDAPAVLKLGTVAGGDMLGLPVGAIASGMRADLVAVDLTDLSLLPLQTLERQIVYSMQPTAIARVMVGGRLVAERGRLTGFDLAEVRARVAAATGTWTRP
ncbi:MAG: amidohydrolase family protein [Actinomycetota bacterium]